MPRNQGDSAEDAALRPSFDVGVEWVPEGLEWAQQFRPPEPHHGSPQEEPLTPW